MIYDHEFSELFDNERQAVVCYLSLELRYIDLYRRYQNLAELYDKLEKGED